MSILIGRPKHTLLLKGGYVGRKSLAGERRAQIMDALYRCISKYGLQRSTIKKIAQEAGVQPGILHHYFKSRDEIIEKLVERIIDDLTASYLAELRGCDDPETRFDRAISYLFGHTASNDEFSGFFYDCWAEAKRNPRLCEKFTESFRRFREQVVQLLAETGKSSGLSPAQEKELANMIIAILEGLVLLWDMDRENISPPKMARMTKRLLGLYVEDKTKTKGAKGKGGPKRRRL